MNIVSVQSWVAYGHVGNAAAMFPLQRLGHEVWGLHTVQFSNHTGYGDWTGQVFGGDAIAALANGLDARGAFARTDAVLSGYLGDAPTGEAILDIVGRMRRARPEAGTLYCCDPVIGDVGRGIYVRPGIAELLAQAVVPQADLLIPNHFELGQLTGLPVATLAEVRRAVAVLQARMRADGPRVVLVTSLATDATPGDSLDLLAAQGGELALLRTPRLDYAAHGAGDLTAALFLHHFGHTGCAADAMARTGSAVWAVIEQSRVAGSAEMLLVAAQESLVAPALSFHPQAC